MKSAIAYRATFGDIEPVPPAMEVVPWLGEDEELDLPIYEPHRSLSRGSETKSILAALGIGLIVGLTLIAALGSKPHKQRTELAPIVINATLIEG